MKNMAIINHLGHKKLLQNSHKQETGTWTQLKVVIGNMDRNAWPQISL
jgi:tellurite resistance-related uncharacterized protein